MGRTKTRTSKRRAIVPPRNGEQTDVLTLTEAAAYLRLPEVEVTRLVDTQGLPGRFTGTEWRFLKSAVQQWLSAPLLKYSKEPQMAVAGAWKDDPFVEEELNETYKRRGRPMTENES